MKSNLCLGCKKKKSMDRYRVLPKEWFEGNQGFPYNFYFPLCSKCKEDLEIIVLNVELIKGNHKEPQQLEIPFYFLLLKDFIMGEHA